MKPIQPLLKLRSVVSDQGHLAQFFLLFKGGQNACFSIPFHKIGMLIRAIKDVARMMQERLSRTPNAHAAETLTGLSEPIVVNALAAASDAETGDTLLWIETVDSGAFSFQLNPAVLKMLNDALQEQEPSAEDEQAPADQNLKYA